MEKYQGDGTGDHVFDVTIEEKFTDFSTETFMETAPGAFQKALVSVNEGGMRTQLNIKFGKYAITANLGRQASTVTIDGVGGFVTNLDLKDIFISTNNGLTNGSFKLKPEEIVDETATEVTVEDGVFVESEPVAEVVEVTSAAVVVTEPVIEPAVVVEPEPVVTSPEETPVPLEGF